MIFWRLNFKIMKNLSISTSYGLRGSCQWYYWAFWCQKSGQETMECVADRSIVLLVFSNEFDKIKFQNYVKSLDELFIWTPRRLPKRPLINLVPMKLIRNNGTLSEQEPIAGRWRRHLKYYNQLLRATKVEDLKIMRRFGHCLAFGLFTWSWRSSRAFFNFTNHAILQLQF